MGRVNDGASGEEGVGSAKSGKIEQRRRKSGVWGSTSEKFLFGAARQAETNQGEGGRGERFWWGLLVVRSLEHGE